MRHLSISRFPKMQAQIHFLDVIGSSSNYVFPYPLHKTKDVRFGVTGCRICGIKLIWMTLKSVPRGVPLLAYQVRNPTSIHEDAGSIPGLAQCIKGSSIAVSWGVCYRHRSSLIPSLGTSICHRYDPTPSPQKKYVENGSKTTFGGGGRFYKQQD